MLFVKTGTAIDAARERFGDFEDWFVRGLGADAFDYEVCAVHEREHLPGLDRINAFSGLVVTGSPAMVSHRHDWSEQTAAWLADAHESGFPMLGVCYGHQLIAHALGGKVGPNPAGRRMGTFGLQPESHDDPLLGHSASCSSVHRTHFEVVLEPPKASTVIASSEGDAHHVLYFGRHSWGVQFHPEFDTEIMRCYVEARRDLLEAEGQDATALIERIEPAPLGERLLAQFAGYCLRRCETGSAAAASVHSYSEAP